MLVNDQAIVGALAIVRNQDAKAPSQVVRFLVNLLTYNDNSSNPVRSTRCPWLLAIH